MSQVYPPFSLSPARIGRIRHARAPPRPKRTLAGSPIGICDFPAGQIHCSSMVPRDSSQERTTRVLTYLSDDDRLLLIALGVTFLFGLFWWWNRTAKKWLEDSGRGEVWPSPPGGLPRDTQQEPATALKYSEQEFQEMVAKALDEVPEEFDKEWNNVAVTVSTGWPTEEDKKEMGVPESHLVFGTYSGSSRTKGFPAANGSTHVIVVYQPALELRYGSDKHRLEQEIRRVVLHELAHHLGMSHQRMKEIGL
jgi:predicted Zn-dependent protease with MMP-like domain